MLSENHITTRAMRARGCGESSNAATSAETPASAKRTAVMRRSVILVLRLAGMGVNGFFVVSFIGCDGLPEVAARFELPTARRVQFCDTADYKSAPRGFESQRVQVWLAFLVTEGSH